jgi:hypothetical protein
MEAPNKQIRPRVIAVVLLGDMSVFLAFVILGKTEHGIIQSRALLRTALPFAIVWCAISPWLGAYRASTLYNLRTTAWRMPLIWLLCGFVTLFARALLTDRPLTLAFALVAIAVQGALLVSWRGVFMMVSSWFSRP